MKKSVLEECYEKAIRCLIKCKPNSCCPVSFLKRHKNLVVVVDKGAGGLM